MDTEKAKYEHYSPEYTDIFKPGSNIVKTCYFSVPITFAKETTHLKKDRWKKPND